MGRILVVEDDDSIQAVIRYHLENAGHEGVFVGDVEAAWQALVVQKPDAAVVDIRLPGPDGWTLIDKMRSDPRFSSMPTVVLTGLLDPQTVERAHNLGCDYLSKPFAASALINKIKMLRETVPAGGAMSGPQHVSLVPVGVVILLDNYQIEGKVHVAPEIARFSEAWQSLMSDSRSFFPVTAVRIVTIAGHIVASTAFAAINKNDVRAVYPMDIPPE